MITQAILALMLGSSFPANIERVVCASYPPIIIHDPSGESDNSNPELFNHLNPSSESALFPDGLFEDAFVGHWYSSHLDALEEEPVAAGDESQTLRFTWLRTFHAPMAFRVTFDEGESGTNLIWKSSDGLGGFAPGKLDRSGRVELDAAQIDQVHIVLSASKICQSSNVETFMTDGAQWIFEVTTDERYCFHDVQSPGAGAFYDLGRMLIDLSGVEIPERDIY